ncbi:MAG: hypothetical protein ACOC8L_04760 [Spirochaetota bacterium]
MTVTINDPLTIDSLTIPNRIVMPPLVIWKADESGQVTSDHLAHYERSAGPGLVIVEATAVSPEGRLARTQLGLWSDEQVAGMQNLVEIIHRSGAVAAIQLHHAGEKASLEKTYGLAPLVPSLRDGSPEGAREVTEADIEAILEAFAAAAERAQRAGFDLVELHGAHGYLISQFLSPEKNQRTDRWGGSLENRLRFLVEALRRVRAKDPTMPVTVRLGLAADAGTSLPLEEGLAAGRAAVDEGCRLLDISNAGGSVSATDPDSFFTPTMQLAAVAKRELGVPVIGVNGVKLPEQAQAVLDTRTADLVAVGRGILADPGWAAKALADDPNEIEYCVDCKPRCFHFTQPEKCPARHRLAARGE